MNVLNRVIDIPVCFHRIITRFDENTIKGNVIRILSSISIMSPQTRISAQTSGIPVTNVIIMKVKTMRMSDPNFLVPTLSALGHKPIKFKLRRFNSIAHTKSKKIHLKKIKNS